MTGMEYFERMYRESSDPWQLEGRDYELRKYALTLASLPQQRYRRAFEPGCSIGLLTRLLVGRCDTVVASDPVQRPLEVARRLVPEAELVRGAIPQDWPGGTFDLVVLSEVLYYLTAAQRAETIRRVVETLEPGGTVVAVHWRHGFTEAECDGDQAHRELVAEPALRRVVWHEERDFTLVVLTHDRA